MATPRVPPQPDRLRAVGGGRAAAWLPALLLLVLSAWAPGVEAGARVREQGGERRIEGKTYTAVVGADGCLTSLEAGGTQILATGVGQSRGGYVFQGSVQALDEITTPRRDTVLAQNAVASVRYVFDDDGLRLSVKNRGTQPLRYFLVLSAEVRGVRLGQDVLGKAPRQTTDARGAWYGGAARLTVEDACTGWGPWMERHQVIDLEVPGGAEKSLALRVGPASEAERSALDALLAPPPEDEVTLLQPRCWQVLQRDALGGADVRVSARVLVPGVEVEAQVSGGPEGERTAWMPLAALPGTRSFQGTLRLRQGAGYALEVRARKGQVTLATARADPLGVGEVFVVAGQSNSTNCGEERQRPASGKVSTFDGTTWRAADDPQPGCHDKSQGGSPWPAFGDALVARLGVPVGLAVTGHGGTSVTQWAPGSDLQRWLMGRVTALGPAGFRALLWHQGESDVGMRSAEYHDRLLALIRSTRVEAGWDVPWFVARVSYLSPAQPRNDSTRSAQQRLVDDGDALAGPDTDTLTGAHRDVGGQGIHFSARGLEAHGKLWSLSVLTWLEPLLAAPATAR